MCPVCGNDKPSQVGLPLGILGFNPYQSQQQAMNNRLAAEAYLNMVAKPTPPAKQELEPEPKRSWLRRTLAMDWFIEA